MPSAQRKHVKGRHGGARRCATWSLFGVDAAGLAMPPSPGWHGLALRSWLGVRFQSTLCELVSKPGRGDVPGAMPSAQRKHVKGRHGGARRRVTYGLFASDAAGLAMAPEMQRSLIRCVDQSGNLETL